LGVLLFLIDYHTDWLDTFLLTAGSNGNRMIDDPAVFGFELINEDSLFFWTFSKDRIPPQQFVLIEEQFTAWLKQKYGSTEEALEAWDEDPIDGDPLGVGRIAIGPLWNIANQRTSRDQDTATFLAETQYRFYK